MLFAITISAVDAELGNSKRGSSPTAFNGHAAGKLLEHQSESFTKEQGREFLTK